MTIVAEERVRELRMVWVWRIGGSLCMVWVNESVLVGRVWLGGGFLG
jgi:hypothetical protein